MYLLLQYGADPTEGSSQKRSLLEELLLKNPENARAILNYEERDFNVCTCIRSTNMIFLSGPHSRDQPRLNYLIIYSDLAMGL